MKRVLIVGGTSGIGLSIALNIADADKIYILGRTEPKIQLPNHVEHVGFNLLDFETSFFNQYADIDALIYCAGIGEVKSFDNISEDEILNIFNVNTLGFFKIVNHYKSKIYSREKFHCAVIGSIAGFVSSPLFSVYAASKASIRSFVESVNVEVEMMGYPNTILHVAPGYIKGTGFYGQDNDLSLLKELTQEILDSLENNLDLFIPNYEGVYKSVMERYQEDFRKFGKDSYTYKINQVRQK